MNFQKKKDFSSNYILEKLENLSLEESSEFDTDTDEMCNIEQEIIDLTDEEELEELKPRLMLPYTPISSTSNKSSSKIITPNQSNHNKNINKPNESSGKNNLNEIYRAKNVITFFKALYEGHFRNVDLSNFVVISDGQLIGIYENEEKARQIASEINIGENQICDGMAMVFPISGNFKPKKK
ncbi:hypothetical protein C1645_142682 [Glomus cerebriforme]|uniref:Uncharacterized protein n=1 Tax=Glomus cerebriforme TaxID=658196 RepID=A0A397T1Q9_9GLOM|nr:hypothetical protein C1645_142682 [Glomus cerebriforme]